MIIMSEWPVDDDSKSRMTDYGSHKTSLDTSTPSVPPQPPPPMAPTTHFEQVLTSSQQQAQQSSMNLYKRIYNSARQLTHHRNRQSDDPKPKSGRHCILSELLQSTSSSFKSNLEVKKSSPPSTHVNSFASSTQSESQKFEEKKRFPSLSSFNIGQLIECKIKQFCQEEITCASSPQESQSNRFCQSEPISVSSTTELSRQEISKPPPPPSDSGKNPSVTQYIESVIRSQLNECQSRRNEIGNLIDRIISNVFGTSPPNLSSMCPFKRHKPSTSKSPTPNKCPLLSKDISKKTYSKLIEFEFSHASILNKFNRKSSDILSLNESEQARIDELESVLHPLQFCLSSVSRKKMILKREFHKCFIDDHEEVSLDAQKRTVMKMLQASIKLLISLTKQLQSFAQLNPEDQTNLLRTSVFEIMLVRSILVSSRCGDDQLFGTCQNHESNMEWSDSTGGTSEDSQEKPSTSADVHQEANLLAKQYKEKFRNYYFKFRNSIDEKWYEDKMIFYLIFAILLFRPTKTAIEADKIKEEHLTYLYLLKRYLEHKFQSHCTAKSHFIRLFDRLEELEEINIEVLQKLLDCDLLCSQSLLEKLYIC